MLYREIIAVCSQIHTKHINSLCGQNVEFFNVKLVVHIVTTGLLWVNPLNHTGNYMYHQLSYLKLHRVLAEYVCLFSTDLLM